MQAGVGERRQVNVRRYSRFFTVEDLQLPTAVPRWSFTWLRSPSCVAATRIPSKPTPSNVMGTVHLLEALRQLGRPCVVVNVTSDKCYENKEWLWGYRENDPMGGHDPYSNSKACAELVTSAFCDSYLPQSRFRAALESRLQVPERVTPLAAAIGPATNLFPTS